MNERNSLIMIHSQAMKVIFMVVLLLAVKNEAFVFVPVLQHLTTQLPKCDPAFFADCFRDLYNNYTQQHQNSSYPDPVWQTASFCSEADKCVLNKCYVSEETCNAYELPQTYIAYHLNGANIDMDGQLDDQAWQDVPWTSSFVDVRGYDYPKPYFDTKVKVRWDDNRLYIAARMQETDFWGTFTQDESLVYQENSFEVFVVPDGSMHNYKELEISVQNVTWDLRMKKPYLDHTPCTDRLALQDSPWSSNMEKKTYTDGIVNNPNGTGTFWSVEMALPFDALANYTTRQQNEPSENETWFMLFTRPEYKFNIVNGQYVKDVAAPISYWSWNPTLDENFHLPNRYGLVQFKKNFQDKNFHFDKWHLYKALFQTFDAMHVFKVLNGMFTTDLKLIKAPSFVTSQICVEVSITFANGTDFEVTAKSRVDSSLPTGHIWTDRYVWFV